MNEPDSGGRSVLELQSIGEDHGEKSMKEKYMETAAGRREGVGEGGRGTEAGEATDRTRKVSWQLPSLSGIGSCISQLEAHPAQSRLI
jgi:hypothetical protein